jgi:hypothetical protein
MKPGPSYASLLLRRTHPLVSLLMLTVSLAATKPFSPAQDMERRNHRRGFQPVVMLTEFNPWAMVVGSDSPTFVLYENGTVIYQKGSGYVFAQLTQADVDVFVRGMARDTLARLKDSYTISEWTDQPTTVLSFRTDDGNYKKILVYGSIRSLKAESTEVLPLPDELTRALRQVLKYENANCSVWMPEYIEVMIWPFEYAKGKATDWPKEWPGLADPKTVKHKNTYSLFIPESQYEELKKFMAQLKQTQAVRIDNKKWAVSAPFPFPHEQ